MAGPVRALLDKLQEELAGIQSLKKEMSVRFALLRHPDKARAGQMELLVELGNISRELESANRKIRDLPAGTPEEDSCLDRIRSLEDKRFQLLSSLNGDHIEEYNRFSPDLK